MIKPESLVEAARSLVGLPFVIHGRDPKVGLDCVGVVIAAFAVAGMDVTEADAPYALVPHADLFDLMESCFAKHLTKVDTKDWQPGDVLTLRFPPMNNHCGIYIGNTQMIHAWDRKPLRQVVITPIDHALARCVKHVWRLP